jgi:uncharacterized membrane protein
MQPVKSHRIESIDLLRGFVMVVMLLDHVRDFFHFGNITANLNPLDPDESSVPVYLTRWITHLCAPTFVALAGISIFLQLEKSKSKPEHNLSTFLFTRGIWFIFLELTIVNFAWSFNPLFSVSYLQVIWAIGISMVCMSVLIHLPWKLAFSLGVLIMLLHNLSDSFEPEAINFTGIVWAFLHEGGRIFLGGERLLYVAYPFIPWLGIMLLGFGAGPLFVASTSAKKRTSTLKITGFSLLLSFLAIRIFNQFGDPNPWKSTPGSRSFWFEFFDLDKYPPSLLYSLVTLGIGCFLLIFFEKYRTPFQRAFLVFGRVPFFFYVLHLYLIHTVALLTVFIRGGKMQEINFTDNFGGIPPGYDFGIAGVYGFWLLCLLLLFPVCSWFEKVKAARKDSWWISYL